VISTYEGGRTTTALGIPVWVPYIIVPVGLFLGAVQYSLTVWRNLNERAIYRSFTEPERYEEDPQW
jgi:TRAP-type C4-dicarboxylate transport system permease small subunit